MLFWLILGFVAGLFVAWTFPEPEFAKNIRETVTGWFK